MRVLLFLLVGLLLYFQPTYAEVTVQVLAQNSVTWDGGDFRYPTSLPQITVVKIKVPQGDQIPEHCHPVPLAAYVAKGAIQVTTSAGVQAVFNEGQSFIEVMNRWHRGLGVGTDTELIVVYAGAKNLPLSVDRNGQPELVKGCE